MDHQEALRGEPDLKQAIEDDIKVADPLARFRTFTRRDFLRLVGGVGAGLTVATADNMFPPWRSLSASKLEAEKEKEAVNNPETDDALGEFLSKRVPEAFQADCLPGMKVLVAKGKVLLMPAGIGRYSNREMITSSLYDRLEARVVADPLVTEERQFLPVETERLNRMLSDWVMPYLDKFAPEKATTGIVLISRVPDNLAASYAKETDHVAVARLDYFPAGNNAFSYYRNESDKMVLTNTVDGGIYGRRIYLLKEPSPSLREKIMTGNFLTSPEWADYYFNSMWGMAHEILHLIVTREYSFSPFDNHNFVRSLSLACVLEFRRGRNKEWDKGLISDELWLMPEFQVLKFSPDFYKDLFGKLRREKPIETIRFEEKEIFEVSEDLFTRKGLGSFRKRWEEWKKEYAKIIGGQSQEQGELAINFDKLTYEL